MLSYIQEIQLGVPYNYKTSIYSDKSPSLSPIHIHPDLEIIYCRGEHMNVKLMTGENFTLNKGEFVIFRGDFPHETLGHKNCIMTCLRFLLEHYMHAFIFEKSYNQTMYNIEDYRYFTADSKEAETMKKYLEIMDANYNSKNATDYCNGAIQLIVAFLKDINFITTNSNNGKDSKLTPVIEFIYDNCESDISLDFLSEKFGYNKSYLSRIFKQATGKTILELLIFARLEKAKLLLTHTEKSVTDIAISTGFASSAYFIKLFKRETSLTPNAYRKLHFSSLEQI